MRVFVVGGTRFIGPAVVRALSEVGHSVAVYHRGQSRAQLPAGTAEYLGDRMDAGKMGQAIREHGTQAVLDMCAFELEHQIQLEYACAGLQVKQLLVSSADVYRNFGGLLGLESGTPDSTPLKEDSPLRTELYPYKGQSSTDGRDLSKYDKIPIEQRVISKGGMVARLPMVYGPGDTQHRTFEYVRRMASGSKGIILARSMANWKSCRGHVSNVAQALRLMLEIGSLGQIYNVADSDTLTEIEWVKKIQSVMMWNGQIAVVDDSMLPDSLKPGQDSRFDLDLNTFKIHKELGYKDVLSVEEGLRETVQWQLRHEPANVKPIDTAMEDRILNQEGIF